MATDRDWQLAYAKQARADLQAWRVLAQADLPTCQHLHFLQMACEKVCKAHLCGRGTDPRDLQRSHAHIKKQLPAIARAQFAREGRQQLRDNTWMIRAIRSLARKIELLAPSIDDDGRHPANCEYPWIGPDGSIVVPAEHNFSLNLLHESGGRHLIKVLAAAIEVMLRP